MNGKNLYLTLICLCSTLALSLNASQVSSRSASSSSSVASLSSSSATTTAPRSINSTQQAIAQNTLGGLGINHQVLDRTMDRLVQRVTPSLKIIIAEAQTDLKATGKEITAEVKKQLQATAGEILAEAKRTGNEVFVRGGEVLLSSGQRLAFTCVVVGVVVFILLQHPYLAVALITSFLSAPAMYLHSKGELKPLIREFVEAYGHTARLQQRLDVTEQTLATTRTALTEANSTLSAARAALAEVTAKLKASRP